MPVMDGRHEHKWFACHPDQSHDMQILFLEKFLKLQLQNWILRNELRLPIPIPVFLKGRETISQQLTYGVVSEGVFAESLRKFCGKFAETTFYCARKGCGISAESLRKFRGNLRKFFCNDPFPNDPISELLNQNDRRWFSRHVLKIADTDPGLQYKSVMVLVGMVGMWTWAQMHVWSYMCL